MLLEEEDNMLNNKPCSMFQCLAQLLSIQRERTTWYLLQLNKVLEPFHICALNCSLIYKLLLMITKLYPLAIQFNTYLLAKLLKHLHGMQLENCLLRTSL